jgi:hypothetical protein
MRCLTTLHELKLIKINSNKFDALIRDTQHQNFCQEFLALCVTVSKSAQQRANLINFNPDSLHES